MFVSSKIPQSLVDAVSKIVKEETTEQVQLDEEGNCVTPMKAKKIAKKEVKGHEKSMHHEEAELEEGAATDVLKKLGKKVLTKVGHGSDKDMRKDLQKKMGVPSTGMKPKMEETEFTFKDRLLEREMTKKEKAKRHEISGAMEKDPSYFKKKYGAKWKEVMYATATKKAMGEEAEQIDEISLKTKMSAYRKATDRAMDAGHSGDDEETDKRHNQAMKFRSNIEKKHGTKAVAKADKYASSFGEEAEQITEYHKVKNEVDELSTDMLSGREQGEGKTNSFKNFKVKIEGSLKTAHEPDMEKGHTTKAGESIKASGGAINPVTQPNIGVAGHGNVEFTKQGFAEETKSIDDKIKEREAMNAKALKDRNEKILKTPAPAKPEKHSEYFGKEASDMMHQSRVHYHHAQQALARGDHDEHKKLEKLSNTTHENAMKKAEAYRKDPKNAEALKRAGEKIHSGAANDYGKGRYMGDSVEVTGTTLEEVTLDEKDELRSRIGTNIVNKKPREGQTDLRNIPAGNRPDGKNKFSQGEKDSQPSRLKSAIKASLGKHTKPNLPEESESVDENAFTDYKTDKKPSIFAPKSHTAKKTSTGTMYTKNWSKKDQEPEDKKKVSEGKDPEMDAGAGSAPNFVNNENPTSSPVMKRIKEVTKKAMGRVKNEMLGVAPGNQSNGY